MSNRKQRSRNSFVEWFVVDQLFDISTKKFIYYKNTFWGLSKTSSNPFDVVSKHVLARVYRLKCVRLTSYWNDAICSSITCPDWIKRDAFMNGTLKQT